jgi:hypothetical protein
MSKGSRNEEPLLEGSAPTHDRDGDFLDDRQMVSFGLGESKAPLAPSIPSTRGAGVRAKTTTTSPSGHRTRQIPGRDSASGSYGEDPGQRHYQRARLELFAEKAGLRFTMKELAAILDELNS